MNSNNSSEYNKVRNSIAAALAMVCAAMFNPAYAGTIVVDDGSSNFRPLASNAPGAGNVWDGQAQSFTAEDTNIIFGFRMLDTNFNVSPSAGISLIYNLYSDDNIFTTLLATRTVVFPLPGTSDPRAIFGDVGFVDADFSSVELTIGNKYTVEITLPAASLPSIGTDTDIGVWTSATNPYAGGRFYFPPSSPASTFNPFFPGDDNLFRITPVAAVPEPETYAMLLAGLGLVGFMVRRHRHAA